MGDSGCSFICIDIAQLGTSSGCLTYRLNGCLDVLGNNIHQLTYHVLWQSDQLITDGAFEVIATQEMHESKFLALFDCVEASFWASVVMDPSSKVSLNPSNLGKCWSGEITPIVKLSIQMPMGVGVEDVLKHLIFQIQGLEWALVYFAILDFNYSKFDIWIPGINLYRMGFLLKQKVLGREGSVMSCSQPNNMRWVRYGSGYSIKTWEFISSNSNCTLI